MIRTLVVDDEQLARECMALLLHQDPHISVVGQCSSGHDALNFLQHTQVDILFIDIQMPCMSGFEVLTHVAPERMPVVIFVTAYDEYAMRAFKVHALDYLLKPYTDKEFFEALHRAKKFTALKSLEPLTQQLTALLQDHAAMQQRTKEAPHAKPESSTEYISRIAISTRGRIIPVNVNEIDWIEAADYYVHLHQGTKSHILRETLLNLEAKLDPKKFVRIHRSMIVRIDAIKELRPFFGGSMLVILHNGAELKLGRSYKQKIKTLMHFPS